MSVYDLIERQPQATAVVAGRVPTDGLPEFFGRAYRILFDTLGRLGIEPAGEPFAYYPDDPDPLAHVEAGVPVSVAIEPLGEVRPSALPGGLAAVAIHHGPYEALEQTYERVLAALAEAGLARRPVGVWEVYLTDPDSEPDPSRWRTRLVVPVEAVPGAADRGATP